ncbi:hypothetical protein OCU04_008186 [Sclerotinia nivalis]|uniref:Uncharacterized protein n=1 Tax=Sclerotinia nivalis TaxID=352851 RepID=A0A9X0AHJ3_9HELO|nr:hypothetical protein OCU04_008186 [Sclerotinia nivalis]
MVIHTILRTAYKINRLMGLCHKHFLDRFKSLEFSEPTHLRHFHYGPIDVGRSECRKYSVRDVSPASWIEEKRITRAFWYIQMFYDLKNNSEKLRWTNSDLDRLRSMDTEEFYGTTFYDGVKNAILTAALYLREASDEILIQPAQQTVPFLQFPRLLRTSSIISFPEEQKFEDLKSDIWREGAHRLDDAY